MAILNRTGGGVVSCLNGTTITAGRCFYGSAYCRAMHRYALDAMCTKTTQVRLNARSASKEAAERVSIAAGKVPVEGHIAAEAERRQEECVTVEKADCFTLASFSASCRALAEAEARAVTTCIMNVVFFFCNKQTQTKADQNAVKYRTLLRCNTSKGAKPDVGPLWQGLVDRHTFCCYACALHIVTRLYASATCSFCHTDLATAPPNRLAATCCRMSGSVRRRVLRALSPSLLTPEVTQDHRTIIADGHTGPSTRRDAFGTGSTTQITGLPRHGHHGSGARVLRRQRRR